MQTNHDNSCPQPQDHECWKSYLKAINGAEGDIREGDYMAFLFSAKLENSRTSGKAQVRVDYLLKDQGKRVSSFYMLHIKDGCFHLCRWAELLKQPLPPEPQDYPPVLEQITHENPLCLIRVIRKTDFTYAFLLRKIQGATQDAPKMVQMGPRQTEDHTPEPDRPNSVIPLRRHRSTDTRLEDEILMDELYDPH